MSGHSKWSKVKHQKATTDVVKAAAFTRASRAIAIAITEGGGVTDANHNFRLRLAIEKARDVNMPKENIQRAIAKGSGIGTQDLETVIYEAFGPSGIALIIEVNTDNRQRTSAQVKNILERAGGHLAGPGAVSFLFEQKITIPLDQTAQSKITQLIVDLESLEDVQNVRSNHENI